MRLLRVLLAATLVVCVAKAGEITTDKEEVIKDAEIISVSAKEVVYKVNNKNVTRPIGEVMKIEYREAAKVPTEKAYSLIELTDGTVLLVSEWAIKGNDLEMTLLSGPAVKMPIGVIISILNNAKEEKERIDWRNRVINNRGKEAVVLKRRTMRTVGKGKDAKQVPAEDENGKPLFTISTLPATLAPGDAKGETIEAAVIVPDDKGKEEVKKVIYKQKDLHGIIYKNSLGAKAPPVTCRLLDTMQNIVMVSKLEAIKDGGVTVTTPSGAKLDFLPAQIANIDYTRGRLDYLSQMQPGETKITVNSFDAKDGLKGDNKFYVYKDSNLLGNPIKVGGTSYRSGLTLLPDVELIYNLNGAYRQFDAVIGIDDETKAEGAGTVEIWGDNKKLETVAIDYRTEKGKSGEPIKPAKPFKKVSLNIKDVTDLKIIFKAKDELNGLSLSVSLGDAKINK
jgi:hypothetical protein